MTADKPTEPLNMNARFARALQRVEAIVKDQQANIKADFTYKYADINQILYRLKPVLAEQNLSTAQPIEIVDGNMIVTTLLICTETGEILSFSGPGFPVKGDPQQAGSALTYMRRYAITSLFSLEAHDDDGAIAHRAVAQPGKRTEAEKQIREMLGAMDKQLRSEFAAEFKDEFSSTLTNLPESRHGDALGWTKQWIAPPPTNPETPTEEPNQEEGY